MPLPQPAVSLTGACSVIYNNTLYEYSQAGFQSLALEDGAEWKTLASGQSVDGGVCVGSTPTDSPTSGLFVVGGTSSNSDYKGLQKFTYSTGKWETITPTVAVTESRLWHSATYINGSDTILVYSGSQDGYQRLSSQTFTITATAPYSVLAYQSPISPPGISPLLLPWSNTQAVMVGGSTTNVKVMLFDTSAGWTDSGATLADPLTKNTTEVKAVVFDGDDGSKHLYTFDMTTSPNTVNRTVLVNGLGAPVVNATAVNKRELDVSNWPEYNSTLAPTATRSGYSLATGSSGEVVISGGNDADILCIFNGEQNRWYNATAMLDSEEVNIESVPASTTSITSASSPTASATQSPTVTAAAAASMSSSGLSPTAVLGIALGSIFGVAIILVALLFLVKRKRQKRTYIETGHNRRDSGILEEKDQLPPQIIAQPTGGHFRGHTHQESHASFSSVAILMGKAQNPGLQRNESKDTKRSSATSIINKAFKNTIGRPQQQPGIEPEFDARDEKGVAFSANTHQPKPRTGPTLNRDGERRSSGWNRYWSGGSTLNMLGFGSGHSQRETGVSEQSSNYSEVHRMTQDSATVPPLQLDYSTSMPPLEGRPEFNRVNSGSPTVSHYTDKLKEGISGQIERPVSSVSSGYSSGIPASVADLWDPTMAKQQQQPWGANRAPSSAYSASIYPALLGAPGRSRPPTTNMSGQPQFAMGTTSSDMSWLNLGEQQNRQHY